MEIIRKIMFRVKLKLKQLVLIITAKDFLVKADKISMLHISALKKIHEYALLSKGDVLEVGPYIGGSTIALSRGSHHRVLSFEKGGAYETHPHLPTKDILGDLFINIRKFNLNNVTVIPHSFDSIDGQEILNKELGTRKIGMLCLDADGNIEELISKIEHHLTKGALLVIDDYLIVDGHLKTSVTHEQVNNLMQKGIISQECIIGWGTWFGKFN